MKKLILFLIFILLLAIIALVFVFKDSIIPKGDLFIKSKKAILQVKENLISSGNMTLNGNKTVQQVQNNLKEFEDPIIKKYCKNVDFSSLPKKITLIAIKDSKTMELWFENKALKKYVTSYDILAASGKAGPKLKEGDKQVPEGIYKIESLNPNSSYHLSMKVNYPNEFDKRVAKIDGRKNLGGDIFIHGKAVSIGCLAMGDLVIEELFYLVSKIGKENVKVIIVPSDFRKYSVPKNMNTAWVKELYRNINEELVGYKNKL